MTAIKGQDHDRIAAVGYGSETGNAQEYAEEVGHLLERLHFQTVVTTLDAFEPASLARFDIVIVVISTTGQGDLPINARLFWKKLLQRKLPPDYLGNVEFTTFGLGDSSYPQFNWAARKLHKRLLQLGAHEICQRGEADEQHEEGQDASWIPWSATLRQCILDEYPLKHGIEPIPETVLLKPNWLLSSCLDVKTDQSCTKISESQSADGRLYANGISVDEEPSLLLGNGVPESGIRQIGVTLEENKRVTPLGHWQDVRHLHLSSPSRVDYDPGDVLTIYPLNSNEDVTNILTSMDWKDIAEQTLRFEATDRTQISDLDRSSPLTTAQQHHGRLTLRKLLTHHLDIRAIPRRSFFSTIAHFTDDPSQKERLLEFADPKYIDELYDYTTRPRRSVLEVLQEFDTVKIPWQWAAHVLPELRGRQFSIASGGPKKQISAQGTSFELLVAIIKYKTVIRRLREGVCTRYIAGLPTGTDMTVAVQRGGLHIHASEAQRPVIMIGPGTGIAPMRSLIWERYQWHQLHLGTSHKGGHDPATDSGAIGETVLFYGCRNKEADFFYNEEWETLKAQMPLRIFTAFSRDQAAKIYVQDILRQESELVSDLLLSKRGLVYVCGSSGKMPQAVRTALTDVFERCGDMSHAEAEQYLQNMEKEGRYKQETW
ncbi:hypothetical protein Q9189_001709 [Teloschistes chrysophthalmus]